MHFALPICFYHVKLDRRIEPDRMIVETVGSKRKENKARDHKATQFTVFNGLLSIPIHIIDWSV